MSKEIYSTMDGLPRVSRRLQLACRQCGATGTYEVGGIFFHPGAAGEMPESQCAFTGYFRCSACGSAGPWDVANREELKQLRAEAMAGKAPPGVYLGQLALFDGTMLQNSAMGEEHLLRLIQASPRNAFLCVRLGNLLRGCGRQPQAAEWFQKALELDPGDVEARHHLFQFAVQAREVRPAALHALALVRHLLAGRRTNKEELTRGIALYLVDNLRAAPDEFRWLFLSPPAEGLQRPEELFIRALLQEEGDEEQIAQAAADRLLGRAVQAPPPAPTHPAAPAGAAPRKPPRISDDKQPRFAEVALALQRFGAAHLDPELTGFTLELWRRICRMKRLDCRRGQPAVWAAAAVLVIARMNFLFDRSQPVHLTFDTICDFFGVKKTTIGSKATEIERTLRLRQHSEPGLCRSELLETFTMVRLSNGMVVTWKMAREMGLLPPGATPQTH